MTRRYVDGALLSLIDRVAGPFLNSPMSRGLEPKLTKEEIEREARRFYYDTTLSGNQKAMDLMNKFSEDDHVLPGNDLSDAPNDGI